MQLKFKDDASAVQRDEVVWKPASQGAADVRPLFPKTTDPKRGSFYIVDLNGGQGSKLLGYLKNADAVEYAERAVRRKLM